MKTPVYENLLNELADGELDEIERLVFDALKKHPDGLTRPQLVAMVFKVYTRPTVMNNDTKDRKVREAISSLRARLVPITSNSGQAGYRLDVSEEARQKMVSEMIKRRDALNAQIERMMKFYSMPVELPKADRATQGRLI